MSRRGVFRRLGREELGATSILVVLLMTVLLVCAALVIDVGAIQARKAQLQDAADAAALAIAEECVAAPGSSPAVCAPAVVASAWDTADDLATANLADGDVEVVDVAFDTDRVRVTLASTQVGYFSPIAEVDRTDLRAAATAAWTPSVIPLSLAMAACNFPDPGEETVLQSAVAVPTAVTHLLGEGCGLLSDGVSLSGTGILSGGWLTSSVSVLGLTPDDCSYDPNLLTTVTGTLAKVVPTDCAAVIQTWNVAPSDPQLVLLPVFDDSVEQLLFDDVFGFGTVDRFALVEVTGYSLTGLLGIGTVPGSDPALCRSTDGLLGGILGELGAATLALIDFLSGGLLNAITGCQALEGTFVGFVDTAEASELLAGVRLVE
jgi:Flp pilus assembly protein TadG